MATSKKLKIGFVLDTSLDPMDGVQQYVVTVGEWLRTEGHDVHYLVGQTETRALPGIHSLAKNISVRFNGNRTTIPLPTSRRKLKAFLDREKFDVLHVQIPHSPFMAQPLILGASPQTAVVGTFHIAPYNNLVRVGNRALGVWLRASLRRFDKIISVSSAAQAFAKSSFKVDSVILPNVVDYSLFHNAQPLPQYADDSLTILFLGRLVPRKGCKLLLEAAATLAKDPTIPPFRVVVCGKGPLMKELQQFSAQNGLDKIVEFVGFVDEVEKPRYYASADISVFPSSAGESFGIVLLEAMASGNAAVLAGDNPGYRSVMEPRPELIFDPKNADKLSVKLAELMTNTTKRNEAKAWGAQYTHDFDTAVVGEKLVKIYDQALRKRREQ
jgi:phosphatidylinositol alpha-mannosyltransferase